MHHDEPYNFLVEDSMTSRDIGHQRPARAIVFKTVHVAVHLRAA